MKEIDKLGKTSSYLLQNETYTIIGAAMEVYYKLGNGFAEPVYQEALEIELNLRGVPFVPQKRLMIDYKDHILRKGYRADFFCYEQVVVEIKAISCLTAVDWSQVMNYLKASSLHVGLLFNFGTTPRPEFKRIVI